MTGSVSFDVRDATAADETVLWSFLAIAAYEPDAAAARAVPMVAAHLTGWLRSGDFGCLATRAGEPVGAAWARQFTPEEEPAYYAGPAIPEVSIGVLPDCRGQGLGGRLLDHLTAMARDRGCEGLCLNVRDSNPAVALYERAGFSAVPGTAIPNRVGGQSFGMLLLFSRPHQSAG